MTPTIQPPVYASSSAQPIAIQEQIRQTQLEIDKLSGNVGSMSFQPATTGYGFSTAPVANTGAYPVSGGMAMGMGNSGQMQASPYPVGYSQQMMQPMQAGSSLQYGGGYAAQSLPQPLYTPSSIAPSQPQHQQMQYSNMTYNMASSSTGYQPPMGQQPPQMQYLLQQQQQQQQQQHFSQKQSGAAAAAKSDPFDFLS
jgi:hypothetical protein